MGNHTSGQSQRNYSLDGLRGVASLVVVLHHSLLVLPQFANAHFDGEVPAAWSWLGSSPLHVFWAGSEAVYVFFVLSGLVLTLPVLDRPNFDWRAYYPSRLIRLYLPVWAALALTVMVALLLPRQMSASDSAWMQIHDQPMEFGRVLLDSLLVGGTSNLLTPLWSLQWEILFSLLLPLYVWIAVRFSRQWYSVTATAFALCLAGVALHVDALRFLPMFMLGAVIAVKLPDLRRVVSKMPELSWLAVSIVAVCLLTAHWTFATVPAGIVFVPAIAGAVAIVLIAILWPSASRTLERPAILFLGKISFSLYLVHEPIVVAVGQVLPADHLGWTPLVALPLSVGVGYVFFRLVEVPSHILSQRTRNSLLRQQREAAAGAIN